MVPTDDSLEAWEHDQWDAVRHTKLSVGKGKAVHLDELSFCCVVRSKSHVCGGDEDERRGVGELVSQTQAA